MRPPTRRAQVGTEFATYFVDLHFCLVCNLTSFATDDRSVVVRVVLVVVVVVETEGSHRVRVHALSASRVSGLRQLP